MPIPTSNPLRSTVGVAVALISSLGAASAGPIVINEIHYAPADKTVPEEFVELYNNGAAAEDLSGWILTGGIELSIPAGTVLAPGEHLVVAQDPATIAGRSGAAAVIGPFSGRLSNDGERIALYNAAGGLEDQVDYGRGFPWPTVGGDDGHSIELIHPDLDNDLGGSWRAADPAVGETTELVPAGAVWRYRAGTSEASAPVDAWRDVDFGDGGWPAGAATIGYGENFVATLLNDMRNGYTSVFLRRRFDVADLAAVASLTLEVRYDDGFNAWINGVHVAGANVPAEEMPFDGTASSAIDDLSFNEFRPPDPTGYLVEGANVLAIQLHNASLGGSSDAFIDARLVGSPSAGAGPTPGARNAVFSEAAPPQMRQVRHAPAQPASGDPVVITVKVTDPDGVGDVTLEYQLVDPGSYIRLRDAEYETNWTPVSMNDLGLAPDAIAQDAVYTALIPRELQSHRRLVRYRITATDTAGASIRAPYADDPQPNFAYFVYDGVPGWRGASRPGVTPVRDFPADVMRSLPVYHLIAREGDVIDCQYNGAFENVHFQGTMVYEGVVYDHIEFEVRGEFSTYVSGKNKWRFHFNRGHAFQARDNHGRRYRERWRTMNLSAAATPWVPTNRGMAALGEAVAFKLYALAGGPSPNTNFLHFRIIDEAVEAHPTDQYRGDLWGLYMTIEHTDGAFLDERGLPDGNVYKIEGGGGDKRNQGPTHPTSTADYDALRNGYNTSQPIAWWRANVDLEVYYGFRAVNRAVNNMDLREGWNICQYHNPETGRWEVIPWDLDMLYMPVTHWSGVMNFQNALSQHAQLALEYRNRARELQDLLLAPDQLGQVVDELAAVENPPGEPLTFVDVDEAMWNYHPRTAGGHRGAFYRNPSTHGARGGTITRTLVSADHEGMAQWIKDFVLEGYGADQLESNARDLAIPETPAVTAIGDPGFPVDDLRFRSSAFADPQGVGSFAAMEWRLAEVLSPGVEVHELDGPAPLEIDAVWESGELAAFAPEIVVPADAIEIGARCRVRVRMRDTTGRWSHWSPPVEFTTAGPRAPLPQQRFLRITEIMYNPPEGEDLEFIEVMNVGPDPIDLTPVAFTGGVEFRFADGDVAELDPGAFAVVVGNRAVFRARYGAAGIDVAGEYSGRLDNAGERVVLSHGPNAAILDFAFGDDWHPASDGGGHSLVVIDPWQPVEAWSDPAGWRESAEVGGSPGRLDSGPLPGGRQVPGDANQDAVLDISDAVRLLRVLFTGGGLTLPCEGEAVGDGGNLVLLDFGGDAAVNLADAVGVLGHLFRQGPAHVLGAGCVRIEGCPEACSF